MGASSLLTYTGVQAAPNGQLQCWVFQSGIPYPYAWSNLRTSYGCTNSEPPYSYADQTSCATSYSCRPDQNWTLSGTTCTRPDTKGNGPLQCPQPATTKPIALGTGNKWLVETDIAGNGSLSFTRTYNSNPGTVPSAFGATWRSTYSQFIGLGFPTAVWLYRPDGKSIKFNVSGSSYTPDADITDRLYPETNADGTLIGYRFETADHHIERYDTAGHLTSLTDARDQAQTLTYSDGTTGPNGGFVLDAAGNPTVTALPTGLLIKVTDPQGRTLQFGYDASSHIVKLLDPSGGIYHYTYDAANNLVSVTTPDNQTRTYHYNEPAHTGGTNLPNALTGITDENGVRYISYTYDSTGRAIGEVLAGNVGSNQLTFGSNQTTLTDARGTARTYNFQTILGVVKSTGSSQPGGAGCGPAASSLTYDGNGNIASRTDFNGNDTTYSYDLTRNLETQRTEATGKPESRTTSTNWHPIWRLPVKVAEPKKLTTTVYNGDTVNGSVVTCAPPSAVIPLGAVNQPIGVLCRQTEQATTDANGSQGFTAAGVGTPRTRTWTYNAYGQVLTMDGPRTDVADVTTYTYYDATDPDLAKRGHLASVSNALGQLTQITAYDLHGNPLTLIDPNGVTTTLTYDPRQRLTSRQVGSQLTTYQYDGVGQLLKATLPDGSFIAYTWDPAHRLSGVSDALGNQILYTLDAMGNRIKEDVRDPSNQLSRTRQRLYDALNRLAQDIGAQNQITAYEYDANGNRSKVTDPLARSTLSAYDPLNRLIRITDPAAGQTKLTYDGQDRLTQVTDPRNLITRYTLDGLGNRLQLQSPDTGTTSHTVDAAGNLLTRTDAKGQITSTIYDALNRPTLITWHDGSQLRATWDQGPNGIGRLSKLEELTAGAVTGSLQTAYDAQGSVQTETRSIGATPVTHSIGYAWSAGKLSGLTLPSGRQLAYTRNGAGQISQVSLTDVAPNAGQTKLLASAIAYHPFGGLKSWTDGAGQVHNRNQDQDGRITGYTLGSTPWLLSYDAASRITAQVDGSDAANSGLYGYDALDHLNSAQLPSTTYGYSYDATGNRSTQTIGATTRAYVTDPASNQLQSIGSTPPKTYSFDANGSITGDGQNLFAYDARGRLSQATTAAGTTQYRINALGQRVRKTTTGAGATDTIYHYDLAGHLLAESDASGAIKREYLWLDDTPLAVLQ